MDSFEIQADVSLEPPPAARSLSQLTAHLITQADEYLTAEPPRMLVVQGDTTTAMCWALAAFYRSIPVSHVEAGLRTYRRDAPFPEEINRQVLGRIATLHFAPTPASRDNLLAEGADPDYVWVTGNSVVDALKWGLDRWAPPLALKRTLESPDPILLVTAHRRESWGRAMDDLSEALGQVAAARPEVTILFPLHPNPAVRQSFEASLCSPPNVHLMGPIAYREFVHLLNRADLVLTDSGGIQEEAVALGKPVLVMRETTERPEGIATGLAKLVSSDPTLLTKAILRGLATPPGPALMDNPYGNGTAGVQIAKAIHAFLLQTPC